MSRAKMFTGPSTPSAHKPHSDETRKKIGEANKAARDPSLLQAAKAAHHLCLALLAVREGPTDELIEEMCEALAEAIGRESEAAS